MHTHTHAHMHTHTHTQIQTHTHQKPSGLELLQASDEGELDKVKQLVEVKKLNPLQEDRWGDNALHHAAAVGHLPVVKYLIEEQSLVPTCAGQCRSPLHRAARYNQLEVVKYLIVEQHVDPQCRDADSNTPLHEASRA